MHSYCFRFKVYVVTWMDRWITSIHRGTRSRNHCLPLHRRSATAKTTYTPTSMPANLTTRLPTIICICLLTHLYVICVHYNYKTSKLEDMHNASRLSLEVAARIAS